MFGVAKVRAFFISPNKSYFFSDYFDFYLSNQDVTKSKPHPEIYLKAIERFGVLPNECLVLEDNINGIRAATDAGAHVMEISQVSDVNYANISKFIQTLDSSL